MSLMKLAFSLESWSASGASSELTSSAAIAEGLKNADRAVEIFQEVSNFLFAIYLLWGQMDEVM